MDVRQATIDSVVADGQPRVIDAQLMQQRGVDVVDLRWAIAVQRFVSPRIRLAVSDSALDTTATQPIRKHIRVVVTPSTRLAAGHAPEFGGP